MIKFENYKKCLWNGEVVLKSQQRFKSKGHDVYTENINKIAISINDDKRLIAPDKIQVIHIDMKLKICWFNNVLKNNGSNNTRGIFGNT